jgi:hypothetical protein
MASGTTSNTGGCAVLFAGAAVVLVLAYWQFFLVVALAVVAAAAHRRFAGNVLRFGDRYGVIEAIRVAEPPAPGLLEVQAHHCGPSPRVRGENARGVQSTS